MITIRSALNNKSPEWVRRNNRLRKQVADKIEITDNPRLMLAEILLLIRGAPSTATFSCCCLLAGVLSP